MSVQAIDRKKEEVQLVSTKIQESLGTVIIQYEGLSVEQMSELRSSLREENVELKVLKNNISSRAYEDANFGELKDEFKGCTAVAFSKEDATAAARILYEFSKNNEQLILKSGTMDGVISSSEEIKELATLPNKDGMLSMLLSVLEAPVRGLAQVTSQVAEQAPAGNEEVKVEKEAPKAEETIEEEVEEEAPKAEESTEEVVEEEAPKAEESTEEAAK